MSATQVAQLVGFISEHAAYHHSEQSLMMTTVNLVQDYIGSNNFCCLMLMASMRHVTRVAKTMPQHVTSLPSWPPSRIQFSTQWTTHYLTTQGTIVIRLNLSDTTPLVARLQGYDQEDGGPQVQCDRNRAVIQHSHSWWHIIAELAFRASKVHWVDNFININLFLPLPESS